MSGHPGRKWTEVAYWALWCLAVAFCLGIYHRPSLDRLAVYGPDEKRWPDDRVVLAGVSIFIP